MIAAQERKTEGAIISSSSVRMTRTMARPASVEITPTVSSQPIIDGQVGILPGLQRAGVIHSSTQTYPPAWHRRAWTETFADSGRCKSRTSFHRVRRGERLLRPRSFRRWGLWSRISILSWSCSFLGCCCHYLLIPVFTLFRVNRKFLFPFFLRAPGDGRFENGREALFEPISLPPLPS